MNVQCGYEDRCKKKDCLNCPRKQKYMLTLTLAEEIVIEDFAVCDLKRTLDEQPKIVELEQNIMKKLMMKIFKKQNKSKNKK